MSDIIYPVLGDVIDGPAFLYDSDFQWAALFAAIAVLIIAPIIVLLCVKSARKKALRKMAEDGAKDPSGEE